MSTTSTDTLISSRFLRCGDIFGIYPYCSIFAAHTSQKNLQYCKYAGRVYKFKKEGALKDFFASKIKSFANEIGADTIVAIPSSTAGSTSILQELFGTILQRTVTVQKAKYNHGKPIDQAQSVEIIRDLSGKKILLVDDICTSGTTMLSFRDFLQEKKISVTGMLACGITVTHATFIPDAYREGTMPDEVGSLNTEISETGMTMAQYAQFFGINRASVKRAVDEGRIRTNGKSGRECRVFGTIKNKINRPSPGAPPDADDPMASARLEKLHADIDLQRMKLSDRIEAIRRECYEQILEEYERAFAPLKVRLIALNLNAAQTASLRKLFAGCVETFLVSARARMSGGSNAAED